jgi:hypothetical protein
LLEVRELFVCLQHQTKHRMEYPSVTVQFGATHYYFSPSESDEWQSCDGYDYHYDYDDNKISVYRVVDGDTDTSEVIHTQEIFEKSGE